MKKKSKEKEMALRLRLEGKSIIKIAEVLGVSKTSVSMWVRDVKLTPEQILRLQPEHKISKEDLEKALSTINSQREIAKLFGVSHSCIRHKFKKFGINTDRSKRLLVIVDACVFCKKQTNNEAICSSCRTKIRRIRTKWMAIKHIGGKCSGCGLVASIETMPCYEFHHRDDNKDFNIGAVSNKAWNSIIKEIEKCDLLCSNCHRIKHSSRNAKIIDYAINNYCGKMLEI